MALFRLPLIDDGNSWGHLRVDERHLVHVFLPSATCVRMNEPDCGHRLGLFGLFSALLHASAFRTEWIIFEAFGQCPYEGIHSGLFSRFSLNSFWLRWLVFDLRQMFYDLQSGYDRCTVFLTSHFLFCFSMIDVFNTRTHFVWYSARVGGLSPVSYAYLIFTKLKTIRAKGVE